MDLRVGCRILCGMDTLPRNPYPSDVSDEEWAFVAPNSR
jgi:hypothetical protein